MSAMAEKLEVHEHCFVSGPRSTGHYEFDAKKRETKWADRKKLVHSHEGGSVPHAHPDTGPSFYGYRQPKVTQRAKGEQFELIPIPKEDQSFDLIILDSAKFGGHTSDRHYASRRHPHAGSREDDGRSSVEVHRDRSAVEEIRMTATAAVREFPASFPTDTQFFWRSLAAWNQEHGTELSTDQLSTGDLREVIKRARGLLRGLAQQLKQEAAR